jgi:hypothetical protein
MTDRPKQRPPNAADVVSGRTGAGGAGRLRRWSVATLIARSRTRAEDAARRERASGGRASGGRATGLPWREGEQ